MAAPMIKTRYPGIYKRGSKYVIKWTDRGVQHKASFDTLDEARRAKGARMKGETRASTNARFDDYAREWLASYQGKRRAGLGDSSRADITRSIEQRAIPFFTDTKRLRLKDIDPGHVDEYVEHLRRSGVNPPSLRKHLATLRALLATAYRRRQLATNPMAGLTYDLGPVAPRKVKVMTDAQADAVISTAPEHWQPLLTFLLQTGLRISEALGLVWGDLELGDEPEVRVRRQRYEGKVKDLKTPNSVRDVPLSKGMVAMLLERRMRLGRPPDDAPVWCSVLGRGTNKRYLPLDSHNLRRRVLRPVVRKLGMPWVGFHTFRHTCASTLFARGKSVKQVQHWLGHADPGFTLRTYIHLQDGDLGGADIWDSGSDRRTSYSGKA